MGRCYQEGWEVRNVSGRYSSRSHSWAEDAARTVCGRTCSLYAGRSGVGVP